VRSNRLILVIMRSALYSLLSVVSTTRAQFMGCTRDATNTCLYLCSDGSSWDLSAFAVRKASAGYFIAQDNNGYTYYTSVCASLTLNCKDVEAPSVIQASEDPTGGLFPYYYCHSAGLWSDQVCSSAAGQLTCRYSGGEESRTSQVVYSCGTSMPGTYVATENPTDNYVISASAPDTCPTLAPPPAVVVGGLSGGGLFLILFSIGVTVYAGGGTYYNIKYKQMPMPDAKQMDAFPHIVYWRELPGLVVDGARQAHGARTHATRPPSQQRASAPVLVRERASRTAHLTPSPCLHYACVAPRRFRRFRHRLSLLMEAREARGQGGARLVFRDERARAEAGPHSGRGGRRAA
jgi:hypothetical protein